MWLGDVAVVKCFIKSYMCCRPLQDLRGNYQLHLPGGLEDGLLLAQSDSGPLLRADSPDLLPRLRSDRPAPPRPPHQHPGPVHRRAGADHPAYDCTSGVAEQTHRGGFIGSCKYIWTSDVKRSMWFFFIKLMHLSFLSCIVLFP